MRKNCFSDQEKLMKFKAEGREFAKILRSLEQFDRTVKGRNNFINRILFFTCSWMFLRYNKLEFKSEKIIGIYKHAGKVRKLDF